MISLKDQTAFITGGSRGIGAACVELFVKAGARVAFTYRTHDTDANNLISSLNNNAKLLAYKMNLESEQDILDTVEKIKKDFGRIDILVNNAGIWTYGEADSMTLSNWDETIRVNLTGTFLVTRSVVPLMKQNNFGRIINITSTAGQRGEAHHSHYAASKGAVISFTKSLSTELAGYGITVNSVAPGWVDTPMCDEVFSDLNYKEEVRKSIPVGRIASAHDIAGPVLFLASDLARHITGEILNVNGGSVLCG